MHSKAGLVLIVLYYNSHNFIAKPYQNENMHSCVIIVVQNSVFRAILGKQGIELTTHAWFAVFFNHNM